MQRYAWMSMMVVLCVALTGPTALAGDEARGPLGAPPHKGPGGPGGPGFDRGLSPDDLDEAIALLERIKPELAERLAAAREENPRRVAHVIGKRFPRLRFLLHLKDRDPQMYELRVEDLRLTYESRHLAEEYQRLLREDEDNAAEDVRDELMELIESHFDVRQAIRERELARLEQRIEDLREQIEARADDRDELIEQRAAKLVGTEDGAEW